MRSGVLSLAVMVGMAGCTAPSLSPKTKPGTGGNRIVKGSKPKIQIRLEPYQAMAKVSGVVVAPGSGAVTLGICTVKEWARCKVEKRPPIPAESVTVSFGKNLDGSFTFANGDAMVPPFFVFSTPESEFRIDPIKVGE